MVILAGRLGSFGVKIHPHGLKTAKMGVFLRGDKCIKYHTKQAKIYQYNTFLIFAIDNMGENMV